MPEQKKSKRNKILKGVLLLLFLTFCWFVGLFNRGHQIVGPKLVSFAEVAHPKMEEVSGLVYSEKHEVLWAHNDSGNEPRLFALGTDGKLVLPTEFGGESSEFVGIVVENSTLVDWEALASHNGYLYITELGNNLNMSRQLGVYKVKEPDPLRTTSVAPEGFYKVTYPDQTGYPPTDRWEFDCEAVFCWDDKLYIVTKNRPAFRLFIQRETANLYSLDLKKLKKENVLTRVDSADKLGGWVTGADISPDGKWIGLVCESPVQSIWLFQRPQEGEKFFTDSPDVRRFVFHEGGQLESLAFAEKDGELVLVMLNEDREMFNISLDRFTKVARP